MKKKKIRKKQEEGTIEEYVKLFFVVVFVLQLIAVIFGYGWNIYVVILEIILFPFWIIMRHIRMEKTKYERM